MHREQMDNQSGSASTPQDPLSDEEGGDESEQDSAWWKKAEERDANCVILFTQNFKKFRLICNDRRTVGVYSITDISEEKRKI